jgi:hypothetical protein
MEEFFRSRRPAEAREGKPFHLRLNCSGINTLSVGIRVDCSAVRDGNEAQRGGEAPARSIAAQQ